MAGEYGAALLVGFGGGGGGRSSIADRGDAGLGIGRAMFGGSGGIGGGIAADCGRGGAFCGGREITGGSFAKTSRRIARKSNMFDFYI
jgi:hypothetical protein